MTKTEAERACELMKNLKSIEKDIEKDESNKNKNKNRKMNMNITFKLGWFTLSGILTIILITLRLTNYIDWAWYWLIAPLWVLLALLIGLFFILVVLCTIQEMLK